MNVGSLHFAYVQGLAKKRSSPSFPAPSQAVSVDLNILSLA